MCLEQTTQKTGIQLFGAMEEARRDLTLPFPETHRLERDAFLETLQERLGEPVSAMEWGLGKSLPLEAACHLALEVSG